MPTWGPMFVLPNVDIDEPIEADGMALVSLRDERIHTLADKHKNFAEYISRFESEFGGRILPSIIIWRDDSSQLYRSVEAIGGFRDAICLSVVPYGWAQTLRFDRPFDILFGSWFSVYPWMTDKNYEYVVMQSMAQLALHLVEEIKPQSTPGITPRELKPSMIDRTLLNALLERWPLRYQSERASWENTALFRSLNMANFASLLPSTAQVTNYDIGRSVSLWVSAFEILVHPGQGQSGFLQVYDILEKVQWNLTECKEKVYEAHGFKPGQQKRNLPCWIYGVIYNARNQYLHGNPISNDTLVVPQSKRNLFEYAPILYRMALAGFLGLNWTELEPTEAEKLADYRKRWFYYRHYQGDMEAALATILITKEEHTARREGRAMALRRGARN
jgi:hypothetical protein